MPVPKGTVNIYCLKHGHSMLGRRTPEYRAWEAMKRRCRSPKCKDFPEYGGRGITFCDRWANSFEAFLADMGPKPTPSHSLDRIDNTKGYEPGNCRWATPREQAQNTRRNVLLTFEGQTLCIAEWSAKVGIKARTLEERVKRGWPAEQVLTTPVAG